MRLFRPGDLVVELQVALGGRQADLLLGEVELVATAAPSPCGSQSAVV